MFPSSSRICVIFFALVIVTAFADVNQNSTSEYVARHLIPLSFPFDSSSSLDGLERFRDVVGNASVVGLGIPIIGSTSFSESHFQLIRFLIERMGFDTLLFDLPWSTTLGMDGYVSTEALDVASALRFANVYHYNTNDTLKLMTYLRSLAPLPNSSLSPSPSSPRLTMNARGSGAVTVGIGGYDVPIAATASVLSYVLQYLSTVDRAAAAHAGDFYSCLSGYALSAFSFIPRISGQMGAWATVDAATRNSCAVALQQVSDLLAQNRDAYIAASSEAAFLLAVRAAADVQQAELLSWCSRGVCGVDPQTQREDARATNVLQALTSNTDTRTDSDTRESDAPQHRVIILGLNADLRRANDSTGQHYTLGAALAARLNGGYVAVGATMLHGNLTAVGVVNGTRQLVSRVVTPPPPGQTSLEDMLAVASPAASVIPYVASDPDNALFTEATLNRLGVASSFVTSTLAGALDAFVWVPAVEADTVLCGTRDTQLLLPCPLSVRFDPTPTPTPNETGASFFE